MTLRRNILANYIGSGVVSLAPILALPWYLSLLGPQQFGLLGFIVTLQAILALVDAGMSQALVREITIRLSLKKDSQYITATLLFDFERIYWCFAILVGCITMLLANFIALNWLKLGNLPLEIGRQAIYGAGLLFVAQFPGSIYRSLLVGAQAQIKLNGVMLSAAVLRHIGGVIVVIFWPTLMAYLIWHILISFLETLIRSKLAWDELRTKRSQVKYQLKKLRPTWSLIAGMSGAAWLGALTVQMDKIILSKMIPIEQFGYYVIASMIAGGMLQLIYPLIQAVLPRVIQLRDRPSDLFKLNFKLFKLIALISSFILVFYVLFGNLTLDLWLMNSKATAAIHPLLNILLLGTLLNAFYNVGYINWIAFEKTKRIINVNLLAFVLSLSLVPSLVVWLGAIGAAFSWLIINLIGFALSLEWIKHK